MPQLVSMSGRFGKWLKTRRGRKGEPGFFSQARLARQMGVDPTYISQLEAKAAAPSFDTRQRIHAVLGTDDEELDGLGIIEGPATRARRADLAAVGVVVDDFVLLRDRVAALSRNERRILSELLLIADEATG